MVKEVTRKVPSGYLMIVILVVAQIASVLFILAQAKNGSVGGIVSGVFASTLVALSLPRKR